MFKKWDIIIIIFLICFSFIPELIFGVIMGKSYNNTYAEITLDGKFYKKVPLSEHKGVEDIQVKTSSGYNTVEIKDKSIGIIEADCKDKICVNAGFVSEPGQVVVCLPHKLMIEVKGDKKEDSIDVR